MFSKLLELAGLALIAVGLALYLSAPAGMIFGGASLVLIGSATDDAAVGAKLRRGFHYTRYLWQRQILKENGIDVPRLSRPGVPEGWVLCECGRDEDCPVCGGLGYVPDPRYQEDPRSPHPRIRVNPQTQVMADQLARSRQERAKLGDRTPALSRHQLGEE